MAHDRLLAMRRLLAERLVEAALEKGREASVDGEILRGSDSVGVEWLIFEQALGVQRSRIFIPLNGRLRLDQIELPEVTDRACVLLDNRSVKDAEFSGVSGEASSIEE